MEKLIFKSENIDRLKLLVLDEEIKKDKNKYYFITNSYSGNTVTERKLPSGLVFDIDNRNSSTINIVKLPYDNSEERNALAIIEYRIKNLLDESYDDYKYSHLIKSLFRYLIYLEQLQFVYINAFHDRKFEIITDVNNFIIGLKNNNLLETYKNFNFGSVARLHNIDIGIYLKEK